MSLPVWWIISGLFPASTSSRFDRKSPRTPAQQPSHKTLTKLSLTPLNSVKFINRFLEQARVIQAPLPVFFCGSALALIQTAQCGTPKLTGVPEAYINPQGSGKQQCKISISTKWLQNSSPTASKLVWCRGICLGKLPVQCRATWCLKKLTAGSTSGTC